MKTIKETINEVMKEHYNSNDIQEFSLWVDSLINEADKDEVAESEKVGVTIGELKCK